MLKFTLDLFKTPIFYTHIRKLAAGSQENTKRFILSYIKKFKCQSILDLCCGTGDFMIFPKTIEYLGVDINQSFIAYAQNKFKNKKVQFICQDILSLNLGKQYDAILLISTIHHFSDAQIMKIIEFLKPIVKKVVIVADIIPDPPNPISKMLVKLDGGNQIRMPVEKIALFKKDFIVIKTKLIKSLFAYQFGIVAIPKKYHG